MIASHGEKEKPMELKKAPESIPSPPSATLGTLGIVREACKLIWKNKKVISALILLMFIPYTILALLNDFPRSFLMNIMSATEAPSSMRTCNCSIHGTNNMVIHDRFRSFVAYESLLLAAFWFATLVIIGVAIYSSAATYGGTGLTHGKIRETIVSTVNRAAITWLYIFLLSAVYVAIGILAVRFVFSAGGGFAFVLAISLTLVFMLLYLLLSSIWMLTLVVSIVEPDCFGVAALAKASELIKGRRFQGSVIMLLLVSIPVGLWIAYTFFFPTLILRGLGASLVCPLKIFTSVVYTVFYYECKKAPGIKAAAPRESMAKISPSSDVKTNAENAVV